MNLEDFNETEDMQVIWTKGEEVVQVKRALFTVDEVARGIYGRYLKRADEQIHFDFGYAAGERVPTLDEIKETIVKALKKINKSGGVVSKKNKKEIDMYFNSFLPKGSKQRIFENKK